MKKVFALLCVAAMTATTVPALAADETAASVLTATNETAVETPAANETAAETPVTNETATETPVANETETPVATGVTVVVNQGTIDFADQTPVIQDNRTLIPVRAVLEAMNAMVTWSDETKTVFASRGGASVSLTIGSNEITVSNGDTNTTAALDVPAQIIGDRTLIPLRAVCEAFGAKVEWDEATRTVTVTDQDANYYVTATRYTEDVKAADGTVVLHISLAFPQLNQNADATAAAAFNTMIAAQEQAKLASLSEMKDAAVAEYAALGADFHAHEFDASFNATYYDGSLLSYTLNDYTFTGGAHGSYDCTGAIYSLTTGKALALTDVLKDMTQEEADAYVKELFAADIAANPDQYMEDAKDTLAKADFPYTFYLTADGVTFTGELYTLKPYAGGIPAVHVSYANMGEKLALTIPAASTK